MSSTLLTFLYSLGKRKIWTKLSLLWDKRKNTHFGLNHIWQWSILLIIYIKIFSFTEVRKRWTLLCWQTLNSYIQKDITVKCSLTGWTWIHMECQFMHVFICVAVHMQAYVCLFVCVCRSVKGSSTAYKAHCVSTGDMWLGERAPSKSLF